MKASAVGDMRVVLDVFIANKLLNGFAWLALVEHEVVESLRVGFVLLCFTHLQQRSRPVS